MACTIADALLGNSLSTSGTVAEIIKTQKSGTPSGTINREDKNISELKKYQLTANFDIITIQADFNSDRLEADIFLQTVSGDLNIIKLGATIWQ